MLSLSKLKSDTRGATLVEYLVIAGAVGLVLVAAAVAIRDGYAQGFIDRSNITLGVD
jgi:Flp pilus assembly pilin Flp